jgi:hypothetical protein
MSATRYARHGLVAAHKAALTCPMFVGDAIDTQGYGKLGLLPLGASFASAKQESSLGPLDRVPGARHLVEWW